MAPEQRQKLKHVVIVGQSGAGKSSIVNMLCPGADAPTWNDAVPCTTEAKTYTCVLDGQECTVQDTVCIPEGGSRTSKLRYLKELVNRRELHLLVYCMSGQRCDLKKSSQTKNYRKFKSIVGTDVPFVVVVTKLEGCSDREIWWSKNAVQELGMDPKPGYHACVTAVPWNGKKSGLYEECREVVKNLIRERLGL